MPKIKPVLAWGVVWPNGGLHSRTFVGERSARYFALSFADSPKRPLNIVRVRITVVQSKKRGKK